MALELTILRDITARVITILNINLGREYLVQVSK